MFISAHMQKLLHVKKNLDILNCEKNLGVSNCFYRTFTGPNMLSIKLSV